MMSAESVKSADKAMEIAKAYLKDKGRRFAIPRACHRVWYVWLETDALDPSKLECVKIDETTGKVIEGGN